MLLHPRVIFADQQLAVLFKPAGPLSQPYYRDEPSLVEAWQHLFGRPYIGIVHRLDRNVSGLIVAAKRSKAAARLAEQVRNGEVQRRYLGWVICDISKVLRKSNPEMNVGHGIECTLLSVEGPNKSVRWTQLLKKNHATNTVHVVESSNAATNTSRAGAVKPSSLIATHPSWETSKYGGLPSQLGLKRLTLHAHALEFRHPTTQEHLMFEDPLPQELQS
ncbi:pseudouridine synthase, partial [Gonapodya prolifera JEL478]